MLSTLRHTGGKRWKESESGAAADEDPGDGDGYAVKMLQRLLDVSRPKRADSRSLWPKHKRQAGYKDGEARSELVTQGSLGDGGVLRRRGEPELGRNLFRRRELQRD